MSGRDHKHKHYTKEKKLAKLIASGSDTDADSEHELSYYIEDRVKLMKEVLKIIKPKKIKKMAPDCMKNMDHQEVNSILLEELLGISNKRLKYIFEGKILDEESSTDEDQPIDVISLDDISDDDFVVISDEEVDRRRCKHKKKRIKEEPPEKIRKVKKEKSDKEKRREIEKVKKKLENSETINSKEKEIIGEKNLMSVLELLELQARARAIKSQLELENKKKLEADQQAEEKQAFQGHEQDDDAIIMEVPQEVEILITSSDSETEGYKAKPKSTTRSSPKKAGFSNIQQNKSPKGDNTLNEVRREKSVDQEETRNKTNAVSDMEDGEISDVNHSKASFDNRPHIQDSITECSSKVDSDSSSNDNLQVVLEREKRKRNKEKNRKSNESLQDETDNTNSSEILVRHKEDDSNINQERSTQNIQPDDIPSSSSASGECNTQNNKYDESKISKIDIAIKDFMETEPPIPFPSEKLEQLEKEKAKTTKINKEKRLKNLKNKLESYKQEVGVESNVNVLENIVIKPKNTHFSEESTTHLEHSDDLVINVDQDDLDCMICD